MKSTSLALLIVAALFAVGSSELETEYTNTQEEELTFYGEETEVDFRFLKAKGTKSPTLKSTKSPTLKSTKAPTMKSRRELV
mmetsp:Transcript_17443/g.26973  ORF Transcript_17443/g.26973 Transcript_17443/m.26973 type:complete len:82 (-) Transcript_17443:157-402(-)